MDGFNIEHSDSDSGESWTLLDHASACVADSSNFEDLPKYQGNVEENIEKDEDTDGISIISDNSDPECSTPCELNYDKTPQKEEIPQENRPTELHISQNVLETLPPINSNNNDHGSLRNEDFLGDNTGKLKTYVHKRNKRLSTVLNIIVLGSVITAAGVAIGHMWGVRDDCSMHTTPSVNKILSNLYKLQEENAYLRNKIKELTLINNIQMTQRKFDSERLSLKQNRCKKLYEASIDNKNVDKLTKCMDDNNNANNNHLVLPEYEKEFLGDIEKLKIIYEQNKSWLDDEISKRLKSEKVYTKNLKNTFKSTKLTKENLKTMKDENLKRQLEPVIEPLIEEALENLVEPEESMTNVLENTNTNQNTLEQKITYADSLKSNNNRNKRIKRSTSDFHESNNKEYKHKKKAKKDYDTVSENTISEDELKKDDRYFGPKHTYERKKHDRQKTHKKQKRRNKYEQWEMKGGYMKDYDDFSVTSSKENENASKNTDKNDENHESEKNDRIDQVSEIDRNLRSNDKLGKQSKRDKGDKEKKDLNWYEKRAMVRQEARKKLEKELFDETESSPNNARWYFRRMQRREQCRAKGDNSTYRKLFKRNMNFKMKH